MKAELRYLNTIAFIFADCQTQADIAFLLDGSGSVRAQDFQQMKEFVIRLISSFNGKDTKVILLL